MVLFQCESSVDGILSAVYDAWDSRIGIDRTGVRIRSAYQNLELFASYCDVVTDPQKAAKVARSVRAKMGQDAWQMIYQATLSAADDRAACIYRVLVQGMRRSVPAAEARRLIWKLQDPDVARLNRLALATGNEARRYMEFVRFRELENGVLFSEIHGENEVLPLIGDHFSDRFPNEDFVIYDNSRSDCLLHGRQRPWFILRNTEPPENAKNGTSADETEIARLWRGFCRSISIEGRENRKLQQSFWPKKYRPWMTEGQR